eukprot:COSAG01_NODE_48215_length_383_cov_0.795775_1_plen_33_part_10
MSSDDVSSDEISSDEISLWDDSPEAMLNAVDSH